MAKTRKQTTNEWTNKAKSQADRKHATYNLKTGKPLLTATLEQLGLHPNLFHICQDFDGCRQYMKETTV